MGYLTSPAPHPLNRNPFIIQIFFILTVKTKFSTGLTARTFCLQQKTFKESVGKISLVIFLITAEDKETFCLGEKEGQLSPKRSPLSLTLFP